MENKPNVLAGTINIHYDYIVGKVIKNGNVSNKKQYIQVLTENNVDLFEEGYKAYIFKYSYFFKNIEKYIYKD